MVNGHNDIIMSILIDYGMHKQKKSHLVALISIELAKALEIILGTMTHSSMKPIIR